MTPLEEQMNEVLKIQNDRMKILLEFLIQEVLTGRQSEALVDLLNPTVKDGTIQKLDEIITQKKLQGTL